MDNWGLPEIDPGKSWSSLPTAIPKAGKLVETLPAMARSAAGREVEEGKPAMHQTQYIACHPTKLEIREHEQMGFHEGWDCAGSVVGGEKGLTLSALVPHRPLQEAEKGSGQCGYASAIGVTGNLATQPSGLSKIRNGGKVRPEPI